MQTFDVITTQERIYTLLQKIQAESEQEAVALAEARLNSAIEEEWEWEWESTQDENTVAYPQRG